MAEIGSVIDGKYEILREIGHGGMSVVYLAMDTHLNKQWAVKEIKKKGSGKNDEIIVKCTLCQGHYDFSFSDFYFIFVCCVEASK